ncbi:acyl-CoA carboxylase epsilon subunit [Luteipulveratus halotolerans]|uniref:Acyl-CoA carboxylase subunit epsilon n=1 Tax=Luteipulveratus halotolerans TaxID=1631356 RepID=A0A0L6CJT7_9MICO|nr:acyl-CoA carboxylase epsilon subunit [Luteipulveratus halotolerans]KNX37783.1 hypothetical protein VV01_12500 [Luteipulveratus halotolerans]
MTGEQSPLRVISGDASAEEVAAVLAVLSAAGGGDRPETPEPRSRWGRPRPRGSAGASPDGWVRSGRPG